ncbi:hypothetical protein HMI56_002264, partial [Coelomomyces lativittatus]
VSLKDRVRLGISYFPSAFLRIAPIIVDFWSFSSRSKASSSSPHCIAQVFFILGNWILLLDACIFESSDIVAAIIITSIIFGI